MSSTSITGGRSPTRCAATRCAPLLTAFGVFWGIFMLMVMLRLGERPRERRRCRTSPDSATNSFFVWSQRTSKPYRGLPQSGRTFELDHRRHRRRSARSRARGARWSAPRNQLGGYRGGNNVTRGTKAGAFSVMGDIPRSCADPASASPPAGSSNPSTSAERRKVAVIGAARAARSCSSKDEDPLGERSGSRASTSRSSACSSPRARASDAEREAQTIYIPFTTFQQAFNYGDRVGWFALTAREDASAIGRGGEGAGAPAAAAQGRPRRPARLRRT